MLEEIAPARLAETWDQVGLQVGDPNAPITTVAVALDPLPEVIYAAGEAGAGLLVTHHPLIFRPISSITPSTKTGQAIFAAIKSHVAVFAAHTNLDKAMGGVNDALAQTIGLTELEPLVPGAPEEMLKLTVFVPVGYEPVIRQALCRGAVGRLGAYDECSFQSRGWGSFRPGPNTSPFSGHKGQLNLEAETRLEVLLPKTELFAALTRLHDVHPYEEPAYDVYPLVTAASGLGLGRVGRLSDIISLREFCLLLKERLSIRGMRVVGDLNASIGRVAVCGGSGGDLIAQARRCGADVLVTGDVNYHTALECGDGDPAVVDVGHFSSEVVMVAALAKMLADRCEREKLNITVLEMNNQSDPFTFFTDH
ncbi:MAG: Nif3-like dinuclear metal center hexameric protein [Deltaproteobacteria bacterium]|nr:Nif3-like dinuclear metal center hexameric protein [Deltaproteobacteria bacterium]